MSLFNSHLPSFFRCLSREAALSQGREISRFLRDAVESMSQNGAHDANNAYGMFLCFEVMNNLLEIAMGEHDAFLSVLQNEELFKAAEKKAQGMSHD